MPCLQRCAGTVVSILGKCCGAGTWGVALLALVARRMLRERVNMDIGQGGESYCLQRRNVRLDTPRWKPVGVFQWTWMKLVGGEDLFFGGGVVAEARHVQDVLPPPPSAVESAETYAKRQILEGKWDML